MDGKAQEGCVDSEGEDPCLWMDASLLTAYLSGGRFLPWTAGQTWTASPCSLHSPLSHVGHVSCLLSVFLVSLPLTPRAHCSYVGEARICFSVSATVIASPHGGFFRLEEGSKIILPSVAAQQRIRGINIFPDSEAQGLTSLYHRF